MRKLIALLFAVLLSVCTAGCRSSSEDIYFRDAAFKRAELSAETIEWLEWYNGLTEEEQLSISYIPAEIHETLYGDAGEITAEAGS